MYEYKALTYYCGNDCGFIKLFNMWTLSSEKKNNSNNIQTNPRTNNLYTFLEFYRKEKITEMDRRVHRPSICSLFGKGCIFTIQFDVSIGRPADSTCHEDRLFPVQLNDSCNFSRIWLCAIQLEA